MPDFFDHLRRVCFRGDADLSLLYWSDHSGRLVPRRFWIVCMPQSYLLALQETMCSLECDRSVTLCSPRTLQGRRRPERCLEKHAHPERPLAKIVIAQAAEIANVPSPAAIQTFRPVKCFFAIELDARATRLRTCSVAFDTGFQCWCDGLLAYHWAQSADFCRKTQQTTELDRVFAPSSNEQPWQLAPPRDPRSSGSGALAAHRSTDCR